MSVKIYYHCDGPDCRRVIDLDIHANTWFRLIANNTKDQWDFCSYYCQEKFIRQQVNNLHIDP